MNLIIIQSRNGSTRLPFKSVLSLSGYPTLLHILNRLKKLETNNKIIVATSINNEDDIIEDICQLNNTCCFRGHPTNVLSRFQFLSKKYNPEYITRITGDCPLINPDIILQLLEKINKTNVDYATNTIKRTYPHGFDVEIFKASIINKVKKPTLDDKEHVTPFIYNSNKFKIFSQEEDIDNSSYRVTLDTKYDYFFINKLIKKTFLKTNNFFETLNSEDIVNLILSDNQLMDMHNIAKIKSKFSY